MSKNHELRDFGCSIIRLLAPIGYYYEPKHDSERGGHGEHGIFPGKKESGPRGMGEQPSVSVHAMRFRSTVVVLSASPYCTRSSMTREGEASTRRGVNGSVV